MSDPVNDPDSGAARTAPALFIAGMHRSGTSMTAALCQSAGLFIGARLMPGYPGNERGHFEDLDVVGVHQRSLVANGLVNTGFDVPAAAPVVPEAERNAVRRVVSERRGLGTPWGWKDPRGALFLPFWADAVPEARFLLLFRPPAEVIDSLFRRNSVVDQVLRTDVLRSLRLWCHYNTLVRDFARSHADRVLVREIGQIVAAPDILFEDLASRLGVALGKPEPLYEPARLKRVIPAVRECLVAAAAPESLDVYADLCSLAGISEAVAGGRSKPGVQAACERAFADWVAETDEPRAPAAAPA